MMSRSASSSPRISSSSASVTVGVPWVTMILFLWLRPPLHSASPLVTSIRSSLMILITSARSDRVCPYFICCCPRGRSSITWCTSSLCLALLLFELGMLNLVCCYLCYRIILIMWVYIDYLVAMELLFPYPCVIMVSYVHAKYIYIFWRYTCILIYSLHAHNEGEPNTNRNINILCILALIFVNADYLLQLWYYMCDCHQQTKRGRLKEQSCSYIMFLMLMTIYM